MTKKFLFRIFSFFIPIILLGSCEHHRQIVPYDIDTDEIFKALSPNDDQPTPQALNFGKNNIPGVTLETEFTTSNPDVFIFFENFTILDVNPKINQVIFDFCFQQLEEYGFISENDSIESTGYISLIDSGLNYQDAAATLLDNIKAGFEIQSKENIDLGVPFNAYLNIYPLYLTDDIVTYLLKCYSYTGGAHGLTVTLANSFNLKTGEMLSFNDIVLPRYQTEIREEIAAHMAYSYPIYENITTVEQYVDSLNVWLQHFSSEDDNNDITLQNFPVSDVALVKEGLLVIYQMYELTPGSDGCPVILLPFKDIKSCLKISGENS